jgi:phosphoenolpyruvate carboxylase
MLDMHQVHAQESIDPHNMLRQDIRLLGDLLGRVIKEQVSEQVYQTIESIRSLSKSMLSQVDAQTSKQKLIQILSNLNSIDLLSITRAFGFFLNLSNIAENHHRLRRALWHQREQEAIPQEGSLTAFFEQAKKNKVPVEQLQQQIGRLNIDLVLTAHPTEVTRRTLMHKYDYISEVLSTLDTPNISIKERDTQIASLYREITSIWQSDEIRKKRPTPIDEVKWGLAVVESSLWYALPEHLKQLNQACIENGLTGLSLLATPIRFSTWMGGDRDGNPNVTAKITQQTLLLMRWKACELYWQELTHLSANLSMTSCDAHVRKIVGDNVHEPYRALLKAPRERLLKTQKWLENKLKGIPDEVPESDLFTDKAQLLTPLLLCYESMKACKAEVIAEGELSDTIRRVASFGVSLMRLDIRQEASMHANLITEITEYLGLGSYKQWPENQKQAFLLSELESKRPLISPSLQFSEFSQEVWRTVQMLARQLPDTLGAYIISMTKAPSDILAVMLLQREAGVLHPLRVVPLFETLSDLENADKIMAELFNLEWYRDRIHGKQEIMIGYSDSSKDAGILAASWAQYTAQEKLVALAKLNHIHLTLFHGRGGTVGRGGAPAHYAVLSQPPGSVEGSLRVTEQGEVIRHKYGFWQAALRSLAVYTTATLEASLQPPPMPKDTWRDYMASLSQISCGLYRDILNRPDFISYFNAVTPIQEIGQLSIGSRPAKRNALQALSSLRAIPWVFAWTQNRLILPAWLGVGVSLKKLRDTHPEAAHEMLSDWPFFHSLLNMIEMVLSKASPELAQYYDEVLGGAVSELSALLQSYYQETKSEVIQALQQSELLSEQPSLLRSIQVREPYIQTLNILQVELLKRARSGKADELIEQGLLISISGIAAGMRNTG